MKKVKRIISVMLVLVMILTFVPISQAANFESINADSVFLTQPAGSVTCTLYAATMMMRRYSMLRGDSNWATITANSAYSSAWNEGGGLWHNFSYTDLAKGISKISVSHASLPTGEANRNTLISLLQSHPEGVVIYYRGWPHAVLLTDYTNGVFYCADPAKSAKRIPLSQAGSGVTLTNVSDYWYITSPRVYLNEIGSTVLSVDEGTSVKETKFTWTKADNADYYCLKIWKDKAWEGVAYKTLELFTTSATLILPAGKYQAYVDACDSSGGYKMSNLITFEVSEGSYTLTYNANGGTGAPATQTVNKGGKVVVSSTVPTRSGYNFIGWNTKADGSGDFFCEPGDSVVLSKNMTLYAIWETAYYIISYDANGGTVPIDDVLVPSGNTVNLSTPIKYVTITYNANGGKNAPLATKAYYECLGWSKSSTATTATYKCGEQYTVTEDVTLYAVWANKAYTDLSSAVPTRDGYEFLGWATSSSATKPQFAPEINVNLGINTTLYAVWQKVETPTSPTPPAPTIRNENISLNYKDSMTFNVSVALETSNLDVASVSGNKISAVGTGSADVTATFLDGSQCVYHLNVSYTWWQWIIVIVLFGWIWY